VAAVDGNALAGQIDAGFFAGEGEGRVALPMPLSAPVIRTTREELFIEGSEWSSEWLSRTMIPSSTSY
jgi:hypothetical protein